ncbi:MAG: proline--tRNA ligase [Fusobacteria bacterium]|nr:proline--tRNA ligase [Fusobacteriota bacterium]
MKFSKLFLKTLKENPKDAEVISHKLLTRAGMIKRLSSGVYSYLPLGYRVLKKIQNIVREELEKAGAQEVHMPVLQPAELWMESGRWEKMGAEMMRLKDRHDKDYLLGPTHEEVITDIVRKEINSYKDLPVNLYQIQTKFRDERRPRFALMRGREFLMKDGYSFHTNEASLEEEYQKMHKAYNRIFTRCGLIFRAVEADSGNIGGDITHEIMVLAESGEDEVIYCDSCDYAANIEKAESNISMENSTDIDELEMKLVDTPNKQTIAEVSEFLKKQESDTLKALIYKVDEEFYMVLIRGDYDINEIKLKNRLNATEVEQATDEDIEKLGLKKGYIGPVGITNIKIIADKTVKSLKNYISGGNVKDKHYINVNHNRDYKLDEFFDIRKVKLGEGCPRCESGKLNSARGIEVGQIFKLGRKYTEALNCTYLNEEGKTNHMIMGCYGIGVSRTMAAAIEQNNDENGIIWPMSIAPYHVIIIPANVKDDEQMRVANTIYDKMKKENIEVVLDDRDERPGFKFKDADLIGFPIKIVVGKGVTAGKVELKFRSEDDKIEIEIENIIKYTKDRIAEKL